MIQTTTRELQRNIQEFKRFAQREPVEITCNGRREFVLLSADQYDWLVAASKRSGRTAGAPSIIISAVSHAKMSPKHKKLDALME